MLDRARILLLHEKQGLRDFSYSRPNRRIAGDITYANV
jgi:hypothetical protein